jgi:uncharacterized protein
MQSITIDGSTKIHSLLTDFPFLTEKLIQLNSKYKLLKNPLVRNTMGRRATLKEVAKIGGLSLDELISFINESISSNSEGIDHTDDNALNHHEQQKIKQLQSLILRIHNGEDPDIIKQEFLVDFGHLEAEEVAQMEQSLIDSGLLTAEEITSLCDIHLSVFKETLVKDISAKIDPNHPIRKYLVENTHARSIIRQFKENPSQELINELSEIQIHYTRLQNQLFPRLEEKGFNAPSVVMWTIHDEIRNLFTTDQKDWEKIIEMVDSMIDKEEAILYPTAIKLLNEEDWKRVSLGEDEIGYAWMKPEKLYEFSNVNSNVETSYVESVEYVKTKDTQLSSCQINPVKNSNENINQDTLEIPMDVGTLTINQINMILTNLPVEISFIDENDTVKYYSNHKERIFPRSEGVIGRKVQNCHPQKSLDKVNQIISAFRSGEKDQADFWINFKDKFLLIRYFAIRDDEAQYKGTLEVTQDIAPLQSITGEQRLPNWN